MKKTFLIIAAALMVFAGIASAQANRKVLVVVYSHSGNTLEMAQQIQEAAGADLFEIKTVEAYPSQYNALTEQAKKEINDGYRPEIKGGVANIRDYDIIFIGSPSWWATIAPPVAAFLSKHDLSGKTVVPFVTHGGTGMGRNAADTAKLAPKANVIAGKAVRGGSVKNSKNEVTEWVRGILKK